MCVCVSYKSHLLQQDDLETINSTEDLHPSMHRQWPLITFHGILGELRTKSRLVLKQATCKSLFAVPLIYVWQQLKVQSCYQWNNFSEHTDNFKADWTQLQAAESKEGAFDLRQMWQTHT